MSRINGHQDEPTSKPSSLADPAGGGDVASSPPGGDGRAAREAVANLDAAFYHESASFHHSRAAYYIGVGQGGVAERHIWAAYGHSLNAHESTRACVSGLGATGGRGPGPGDDPTGPASPPNPA